MAKKALLVIDVQNGMFNEGTIVHKGEKLLQNLNELLSRARSTNTPVFYIQHNAPIGRPLEHGTKGWEIHSDISPKNEDTIVQKTTPDSFLNTNLDDELKKQKVEHLIIAGIQTELCVDTTVRRAFSMGYKVTLASDTHSTWDSHGINAEQIIDHHNNALRWFADVYTIEEIKFF
jgi:nicotinamidase-related amidase